jgi:ABC-type branched-subunit amino acid transport system substrate-binding protein
MVEHGAQSGCIGVVAPFSTEESIVAGPMLAAVEAVVDAASAPVDVVACDDARRPERAAAAVAELAARGDCLGVVGPKNGGCALAAVPVAAAAGLPLLLPCATADGLTAGSAIVFRLCAPDRLTAAAAVDLVAGLAVDRLALVADDTPYGQALAVAVRAAASGSVEVVDDVGDAGAAFLAMGEVEQATVMADLRAAGYGGTFVSAEGGPDAPIAALAGPAAEGAWLLYPGVPVDGRAVYAAEAADAARILLSVGRGGAERIHGGEFHGETGAIRFDTTGERVGAAVSTYHVRDGRAVLVS